ncbi:MAG: septum formation initiator family protein [bacterium]
MSGRTGGGPFRRFRRPRMPGGLSTRRLLWAAAGAVLVYIFLFSDFGLFHRWRLAREAEELQAEIEMLESEQERIASEQERLKEEAELERIAREGHGMVREGEHVYRLALPDTGGTDGGGG